MSDDLRTRIAAAMYPHSDLGQQCACGWKWPTAARFDVDEYDLHVADAVIAALGLEIQAHYDPHCRYHRWVTDWEADDE
jgi:hypothetical protein